MYRNIVACLTCLVCSSYGLAVSRVAQVEWVGLDDWSVDATFSYDDEFPVLGLYDSDLGVLKGFKDLRVIVRDPSGTVLQDVLNISDGFPVYPYLSILFDTRALDFLGPFFDIGADPGYYLVGSEGSADLIFAYVENEFGVFVPDLIDTGSYSVRILPNTVPDSANSWLLLSLGMGALLTLSRVRSRVRSASAS